MDKKEQTRVRVERYRNKQKSVTSDSVTDPSVTWETMPLGDIISALPQDIVDVIENTRYTVVSKEDRLRKAYKYQVWHEANFINGIHKDSKYRQYVEVTK